MSSPDAGPGWVERSWALPITMRRMVSEVGGFKRRLQDRMIWHMARNQMWGRLIRQTASRHPLIVGHDLCRLTIDPSAIVNDATFNIVSGRITVGEHVFFGHRVSLVTETHDISKRGVERQRAVPDTGRDIFIGPGAWLASGVTVVGPVSIGADSVVGAGALVLDDVPPGVVVGGVPARELRRLAPWPTAAPE